MENFLTILIKPTPIEIELQTELKVREIQNCEDINQLKEYAVAITKKMLATTIFWGKH